MQNADKNPSQSQQMEMAAKSPAKTPAAGTASPDAATQAKEFGSAKHALSAEAHGATAASPLPAIDVELETSHSADPVERANSRIVSVDNANMEATDNTVDTDAKGLEARHDRSVWHDNVISSNATLENNVPAPAAGLGGIDSRPTGNLPAIAALHGYRVVYCGVVYQQQVNGSRAEHLIRIERSDA
jgi:hypothetical protein